MRKWYLLLSIVMVIAVLAGCSGNKGNKSIKLAYVAWDSEIASTNVVKEVLESKLGYKVEMLQVDAGPMWAGIADGSADAMVAAWLPSTHSSYLDKYKSNIVDLGPNLNGTKIGLAVPAYMDIKSIEDLNKTETASLLKKQLIGIEPGAGIMMATEKAIQEYGLKSYTLVESSSAAMAQELLKAYDNKQPIVVTGWTPHWMFAKMDLKYLDDPKGVYGGDEQIHTLVRKGLQEDKKDAYAFLDRFEWTPDDMANVMVAIQEGKSPEDAAKDWVKANADKVDRWVKSTD
ncbi:glycine betaine ABC transporter substrate-binding protein [Cohnella pontilimi]|uniref:glycine betaine ABC transporter substrate-binding protein n=1 Tax=Cohnella pontilimi TaxID=2564100 RepID=UPI001FE9A94E|nr:glycine betaine ABC transporter substrate-binding protein [Cohnella pontilimi]